MSVTMSKLRKYYSECVNVSEMFLRFEYRGKTVCDETTPFSLKMKVF